MFYHSLRIINCRFATPVGTEAKAGKAMSDLHVVDNAEIMIVDGKIKYAGKMREYFELVMGMETIDAGGKMVLPGFVDSHTHLIFGGFRPDEFKWRLDGESYMSIMERGGGIQSTVDATQKASRGELTEKGEWFLKRMSEMGVTTVEAKSGYGLDTICEQKMLDVIHDLSERCDFINIIPTFLGAHAVPKEYKGRTSEYVDLIISEMLPLFKDKSVFCDIFCEKNVFEIEDSRRLLEAAKALGYKLKLHADEIVTLGGAELAAELAAVSADHLLHISEDGIRAMAASGTIATLLPLTAFALKEPYAPARKLIDSGCAVALATDLNPGSCFSGSIPLTIALACIYMQMDIKEVITALTLNGAAAVDMASETGSIEPGKWGDVVILGCDNYNVLPYYVGMNCVQTTISKGKVVYNLKS